jgi:hypothetical protein
MKFFLVCILSVFTFCELKAQDSFKDFISHFNNFQEYKDTNVDSAVYFAKRLATPASADLLNELLHNTFALSFISHTNAVAAVDKSSEKIEHSKIILSQMLSADNNILSNSLRPIELWTKAQKNYDNIGELKKIILEFSKLEFATNKTFPKRSERYALLIYKIAVGHKQLASESEAFFSLISNRLENNQVKGDLSAAPKALRAERAWYRYLFAYSSFIQANKFAKRGIR